MGGGSSPYGGSPRVRYVIIRGYAQVLDENEVHAHAHTAQAPRSLTRGVDVATSRVTATYARVQEPMEIIHDGAVFGEEAMLLHIRQRH